MRNFFRKYFPVLINFYHFLWAVAGAVFYNFPSNRMKVIGVTGTNGKSTVVTLVTKVLEEAGFKVAGLSSIKFKIGGEEQVNDLKMTMPGRGKIQRFLKRALNKSCDYAVLEVTSEGIKQYRHKFIDFDIAVFTNLTKEHIESHGSFENYRKAKGKLFKECKKTHIVNLDDEYADYFLGFKAKEQYGFRVKSQESRMMNDKLEIIEAGPIEIEKDSLSFMVHNSLFSISLIGRFNIYNSLAAICVGLSQDIDLETCKRALEKIKEIPGRMEIVIEKSFKVIVDYAHTPDSLNKVYTTLYDSRLAVNDSRVICVLGACGGGRDKWKRPKLGEIANNYCDKIILTNEDPYDEDPMNIVQQIKQGIKDNSKVEITLNRNRAIEQALQQANDEDLVAITGKGAEPWMCVAKGKKIPWDDRQVVKEAIKRLSN